MSAVEALYIFDEHKYSISPTMIPDRAHVQIAVVSSNTSGMAVHPLLRSCCLYISPIQLRDPP
jgi:hypothetical protein